MKNNKGWFKWGLYNLAFWFLGLSACFGYDKASWVLAFILSINVITSGIFAFSIFILNFAGETLEEKVMEIIRGIRERSVVNFYADVVLAGVLIYHGFILAPVLLTFMAFIGVFIGSFDGKIESKEE